MRHAFEGFAAEVGGEVIDDGAELGVGAAASQELDELLAQGAIFALAIGGLLLRRMPGGVWLIHFRTPTLRG